MNANAIMTTQEVADRYHDLARQGKWFEIQDELFAEDVRSIEPEDAASRYRYLRSASGKANVRAKAEEWVSRIEAVHDMYFSAPVVAGNRFSLAWGIDADVGGLGRRRIDEIMLYEVKNGRIVVEQFFY